MTKISKIILTYITLLSLFGASAFCFSAERARTEGDIYNACCRVFNNGVAGSGCCFFQDSDGAVYILTNYHVAGKNDCRVQFFNDGEPLEFLAENVWYCYNQSSSIDVAVLRVNAIDAPKILNYVPLYKDGELGDGIGSEPCLMCTTGAPRAQWLRFIRGKIKKVNGNCVFKPTPYGGQSGSSIFVSVDGDWYIGALLTWRTMDEGTEDWGGLAQPISRVLTAMSGKSETSAPSLPDNAIECPLDGYKTPIKAGGAKQYKDPVTGRVAVECSAPSLTVEEWSISGCSPCAQAKSLLLPALYKTGANIVEKDGLGANRFEATALGINSYPTFRITDGAGKELKRYVGYNSYIHAEILAFIQAQKMAPKKAEVKAASSTGSFSFLDKLPNIEKGEAPKAEPPKQDNEEEKETPPPSSLVDKLSLRAQLSEALQEVLNDITIALQAKIDDLKTAFFWLAFVACTLALLCFKAVVSVLKCLVFTVKKTFSFIYTKTKTALGSVKDKVVSDIADKVKEKEKKGDK